MTGSYPTLGFDPAPGTVANVESAANNLQRVAQRMGTAHDSLTKIGRDDGLWNGEAADAFRGTVGDLPKYLDQAHRSLGDAAKSLTQWSHDLASLQQKAHNHEAEAATVQRRVRQAESNPDLHLANQQFPDQASLQHAQQRLDLAQSELNTANDELKQIRDQAQRLLHQHDDLARQIQDVLSRATSEVPAGPDLLERLEHALNELGKEASDVAGKAWNWIQGHSDDINKVGDVLSTVGTVMSVVAVATSWIPGVDAVTAGAAIGINAAALGAHALAKAGGAKTSWGTIGMDAVGAIPGGKAVAAGKNAASQAATAAARDVAASKGTGTIAKVYNAGVKTLTGTGTVETKAGEKFSPISVKDLKADPVEATKDAAKYTHVKSLGMVNAMPGISIDPFSKVGVSAGAAMASAKGYGTHEAIKYGTNKLH